MWTPLRERPFPVAEISTPASVETVDTYEGEIERYRDNGWTYVPLVEAGKYLDVRAPEDGLQDLADGQSVESDRHVLDAMELLVEYPFLLVDDRDPVEIVHRSDLNRREVRDFLYPLFAALAGELAARIRQYYDDPEDLVGMVHDCTLGTWYKARRNDVDLHVAEFLSLHDMIGIVKGQRRLREECGFDSAAAVEDLRGVVQLRNRVMHGNRSLITDAGMLESHLGRIERAEAVVERLS